MYLVKYWDSHNKKITYRRYKNRTSNQVYAIAKSMHKQGLIFTVILKEY